MADLVVLGEGDGVGGEEEEKLLMGENLLGAGDIKVHRNN